jgi:hypothetical protein
VVQRGRLTGRDGIGLAAGLLAIVLGFLWHTQAIFFLIGVVLATLTVIALARRQQWQEGGRLWRAVGGRGCDRQAGPPGLYAGRRASRGSGPGQGR